MNRSVFAFSIVIPAHDEEVNIGTTLSALVPLLQRGVEVVVVANGCADRTADIARSFPGVIVVEEAEPSKSKALNAGDQAATLFPRIYLDADVSVTSPGLVTLARELQTPDPRAGSLAISFNTDGRPWMVRAFYEAFSATPYVRERLVGLGLYGLSHSGHERLGRFPEVLGDDLFVQRLFPAHERVVLAQYHFVVNTPKTAGALVQVRTRVARGNAELARVRPRGTSGTVGESGRSTRSTVMALLRQLWKRPKALPPVLVYSAINALGRVRARRSDGAPWERDVTTR